MASISSLMLFITYLLLFNIFSNGLAFMNDGNNADTYKGADIATIGNSDADMSEDQVIRQAHDPLPRTPQTFTKKRGIGNRYPWPPCTRYGCGKREMYVRKDAVPNGFLATKIRQLQRKSLEQKLAEPPCSRYGCGKRR